MIKKLGYLFFTIVFSALNLLPILPAEAACGGPLCIYQSNRVDMTMHVGETITLNYRPDLSYSRNYNINACEEFPNAILNIEAINYSETIDDDTIDSNTSMVSISPSKISNVCNMNTNPSFTITAREEGVVLIEVAHTNWATYNPNSISIRPDNGQIMPDYLIKITIGPRQNNATDPKPEQPDKPTEQPTPTKIFTISSASATEQLQALRIALQSVGNADTMDINIGNSTVLVPQVLAELKNSQKTLRVSDYDHDTLRYQWHINSQKLDATRSLDLELNFDSSYQDEINSQIQNTDASFFSFAANTLPEDTSLKLALDQKFAHENQLNLYAYNPESKTIKTIQENIETHNGYLEFQPQSQLSNYLLTASPLTLTTPSQDTTSDESDDSEKTSTFKFDLPTILIISTISLLVCALIISGVIILIKKRKTNATSHEDDFATKTEPVEPAEPKPASKPKATTTTKAKTPKKSSKTTTKKTSTTKKSTK